MNQRILINIISRITGRFVEVQFPAFIQRRINACFVGFFGLDLTEFESAEKYPSIQKLFTRSLKKPRIFSAKAGDLISPTDSKIAQFGALENSTILQVKGLTYELKDFLTDATEEGELKKIENGKFINFYLSPSDYHHFHAPTDFKIQKIIHVPGTLFPVKKSSLEKNKNLFVKNERVILECLTVQGFLFYFVAIGALNVGKIRIFKEPRLQTNSAGQQGHVVHNYTKPVGIEKGEDLGLFEMGSSVVILFESGSLEFLSKIKIDQKISFGESFARFN
ncbi:MAG: phosphatidylserine decarboxylase [Candidatus Moraniibacteriota bacterium]